MTTIDEFNKITQTMYDKGYVMVSIHDLIEETKDADGNTVYKPATILLPKDKKAFVLSVDDVSYYHAYEGYGFADKLVLDENGNVMNEYTDASGVTTVGAYDVVPLMDQFVEKHPDASYRGAKGIIALTGYNGVLGYRTDETYDFNHPSCDAHQKKWMNAHPDFNLQNEIAEATKIANAMKENGWEFASHTWGHLRVGSRPLSTLKTDNERWKRNVAPIVGEVDTIIFAHGEDLAGVGAYPENNEKYQYFRNEGYSIFCNVDSNKFTSYYGKDYFRQGRRNLDGYRLYRAAKAGDDRLGDLFDSTQILDPARPPVKPLQ
jgi:peptidoglycan/xylan/chitin deacetylase (PgdA/CDA1 family)